jgi:hypothetical protein
MKADGGSRPLWWSDKHASAWERAKEALRRDWEQTKADFSSHSGIVLNQNVGDTLKQVAGAAPVPPLTMKTHYDKPRDAAKRIEKDLEERGKAEEKIVAAHTDLAVEQVKAGGEVAQKAYDAGEKLVGEQQKLSEMAAEARQAIVKEEKKGQEKLAKQQEKVAEARKDWNQIEPAVRYGYGARMEYADHEWDERVEGRLRTGWAALNTNNTWEEARPHVRHGWDSARKGNHS